MRTVLIANPKGGSGKTTVATNLAGYFATRGRRVLLSDLDRQQSAMEWLRRRPYRLPLIRPSDEKKGHQDKSAEWLIVDSPAGLRGDKMTEAIKAADWVIVPVQPSAFDIGATRDFLEALREEKAIRKQKTFVALAGIRVDARTRTAANLQSFMESTGLPILTYLREAQVYRLAAEQGASLFDIRPSLVARDLQQWSPLLHWLVNSD